MKTNKTICTLVAAISLSGCFQSPQACLREGNYDQEKCENALISDAESIPLAGIEPLMTGRYGTIYNIVNLGKLKEIEENNHKLLQLQGLKNSTNSATGLVEGYARNAFDHFYWTSSCNQNLLRAIHYETDIILEQQRLLLKAQKK